MPPRLRRFALTAHVTCSVGWLGAVAVFLALALSGLTGKDALTVRAAYLAMDVSTWAVIVPLSLASLATGLVQSLGTQWGLFRHYWVVAKLLLNVAATGLLLLHTGAVGRVARAAEATSFAGTELRQVRVQLVADAVAALVALLVATALSVYKPGGLTAYGRRQQEAAARPARWVTMFWVAVGVVVGLIALLHLAGQGLRAH